MMGVDVGCLPVMTGQATMGMDIFSKAKQAVCMARRMGLQ